MESHTAAFVRWRDAPADRRAEIARHQALTITLPAIYRDLAIMPEADLRAVIGPNGKPLGECSGAELAVMGAWMTALRNAAYELHAATDARLRMGHLRI